MPVGYCVRCGSKRPKPATVEERLEVGDRLFTAELAGFVCPNCGERYVSGATLERFEGAVAGALARGGAAEPAAFRFLRKTLGMKAAALADLVETTPETISRWENGKQPIDRRAFALLADLVLDHLEGRTQTRDLLQACSRPRLPKRVRLGRLGAPRRAA